MFNGPQIKGGCDHAVLIVGYTPWYYIVSLSFYISAFVPAYRNSVQADFTLYCSTVVTRTILPRIKVNFSMFQNCDRHRLNRQNRMPK